MAVNKTIPDLESLWDHLLSRDTRRIRDAYSSLDETEQQAVLDHLIRMGRGIGWHPEQRQSALIALETLEK
jgi:hypothetical protein